MDDYTPAVQLNGGGGGMEPLEIDKYQEAARKKGGCRRCIVMCFGFLCVIVSGLVALHVSPASLGIPDIPSKLTSIGGSRCNPQDCTIQMITFIPNGTEHPCKEFCDDLVEWADKGSLPTLHRGKYDFGSFKSYGVCRTRPDLTIAGKRSLVPHNKDKMPGMLTVMDRLKDKSVVLIGGPAMKQIFDSLATLLRTGISLKENIRKFDFIGSKIIRQDTRVCNTDSNKKKQVCEHLTATNHYFPCNCTTADELYYKKTNTNVSFIYAKGIDYQREGETDRSYYGDPLIMVTDAIFDYLAADVSAFVIDFGLVEGVATHNGKAYANFLKFTNELAKRHKIIFMLTMPQHYYIKPRMGSKVGYLDDEQKTRPWKSQACVEETVRRHWTSVLARQRLEGVDIIDLYPVAADGGKFHSSSNCGAFCLNLELYYPFWSALAEADLLDPINGAEHTQQDGKLPPPVPNPTPQPIAPTPQPVPSPIPQRIAPSQHPVPSPTPQPQTAPVTPSSKPTETQVLATPKPTVIPEQPVEPTTSPNIQPVQPIAPSAKPTLAHVASTPKPTVAPEQPVEPSMSPDAQTVMQPVQSTPMPTIKVEPKQPVPPSARPTVP